LTADPRAWLDDENVRLDLGDYVPPHRICCTGYDCNRVALVMASSGVTPA
jgi:hypothetical protein